MNRPLSPNGLQSVIEKATAAKCFGRSGCNPHYVIMGEVRLILSPGASTDRGQASKGINRLMTIVSRRRTSRKNRDSRHGKKDAPRS